MIPRNPNDRIRFGGFNSRPALHPPARRFRLGFDQPTLRIREESWWSTARRPLSAEDIRVHAWLSQRLAVLHHERHGLWPKLRRFLCGNRLVRWLGFRTKPK
jgi:hypothetical protein